MSKPDKPPEDTPALPNALNNAEVERRLAGLEKANEKLEANQLQRHTQTITWIFGLTSGFVAIIAIIVAVLGFISRSETHDATTLMEKQVADATSKMEQNFQRQQDELKHEFKELAGEALKKPVLEISVGNGLLDGQTFAITPGQQRMPFFPFFIKNTGDKKSDTLSIRLYMSANINQNGFFGEWETISSNEKDYPICFYFSNNGRPVLGIFPGETSTMEAGLNSLYPMTNLVNCKLQIFYGGDKPAEARFQMKVK
jgi:hypothetical protein